MSIPNYRTRSSLSTVIQRKSLKRHPIYVGSPKNSVISTRSKKSEISPIWSIHSNGSRGSLGSMRSLGSMGSIGSLGSYKSYVSAVKKGKGRGPIKGKKRGPYKLSGKYSKRNKRY